MKQNLKIGYDAKRAAYNKVGLGSYARNLIENLNHYYPNNEYYLYSRRPFLTEYEYLLKLPNVYTRTPKVRPLRPLEWWWEYSQLPQLVKSDQIQIFHGLSHTLPGGLKCPTVVTMHDLIFLRYPQWFKWHDRLSYARRFRQAANSADLLLTISETTKKDLIDFYNVPADKIKVTYQPCHPRFKKLNLSDLEKNEIQQRLNLPQKMIVCVGTLEPRKNGLSVAKAFHQLGNLNKDFTLIFIGRETPYAEEIKSFVAVNSLTNVRFMSYIEYDDLVKIYNMAYLSVYVPFFEGFGLPVLESMQCGLPVLTSNCSSLKEVGGEHSSFLANPEQVESITEKLKEALFNEQRYQSVLRASADQVKLFSPEVVTRSVMQAYQSLV